MTPTLVQRQQQLPQRARDWAEIQERTLVPLYEAVYEHLDVGPATRLLGLGCGSGLALLLAAARGASVTGLDADETRLALARERLLPEAGWDGARRSARLVYRSPDDTAAGSVPPAPDGAPPTLVTAFDASAQVSALALARTWLSPGTPVVLAGPGPAEQCSATPALRVAERLAGSGLLDSAGEPPDAGDGTGGTGGRSGTEGRLEDLARGAGLRPDGSGQVPCPFGYADLHSALRGLLSTGRYDAAVRATDEVQVLKELTDALHPYLRPDGTVWMPNVFRYLVART